VQYRVCAIDGPGGAGKSTLARQLATELGASIIPMDHFLLPKDKHRISVIAKNYDLDRLNHDVIGAIIAGAPISYQPVSGNGQSSAAQGKIHLPLDKPIIIEGIYSLELRFREVYDFSIYIDVDEATRLKRATNLVGDSESWVDKWLAGEQTYLEAQDPMTAATLILDGAKQFPTSAQIMELVALRKTQSTN
jgi:uridine kinase